MRLRLIGMKIRHSRKNKVRDYGKSKSCGKEIHRGEVPDPENKSSSKRYSNRV